MPVLLPVDIITGFLGSGKTTLIQHVLSNGLNGQRVAVIVNDLAEYNVDGLILKGMNVDQLVKLSNGCVCCSGIYQLGAALQEIVQTSDPSLIMIETSGASAPSSVVSELSHLGYQTDAVITVVDAEQFLDLRKTEPILDAQVGEADFLVLNKLDLVDDRRKAKVKRVLTKLNRRAHVLETSYGCIPVDLVFSTGISRMRKTPNLSDEHPEGMEHFSCAFSDSFDLKRFNRFLMRLPPNFYRSKGLLKFTGENYPRLLNYTCGRYNIDPFPLPPDLKQRSEFLSQIVFVGRHIISKRDAITESLHRCLSSSTQPTLIARFIP